MAHQKSKQHLPVTAACGEPAAWADAAQQAYGRHQTPQRVMRSGYVGEQRPDFEARRIRKMLKGHQPAG